MNQTAVALFGDDMSVDENRYFNLIDQACRNSEAKTISNSGPKHAVYLMHTLLSNAKSRVRLFTGSLSREEGGIQVYANKELAKAACGFLSQPDTSFQIMLVDGRPQGPSVHKDHTREQAPEGACASLGQL